MRIAKCPNCDTRLFYLEIVESGTGARCSRCGEVYGGWATWPSFREPAASSAGAGEAVGEGRDKPADVVSAASRAANETIRREVAAGVQRIEWATTGNRRYPREEDDENNEEGA